MESHLILKISSPILVQFWEKMEAKNTVKTVVEQHIVTFWAPGAGIKSPGVNPQTALHVFNVGVSSTYPASKGMKTVWIFLFVLKAYLCGLISNPTYSC